MIQQVDVGDTEVIGWLKSDPILDSVEWSASVESHVVGLRGSQPDGCQADLIAYTAQNDNNPALYHVNTFRLLPLAVACPAVLVDFSASIETDILPSADTTIQVGQQRYWSNPDDDVSEPIPVRSRSLTVESVTIRGSNPYQVQVVGTQNGNCGAPLQEIVSDEGAFSTIEIFDLLRDAAPCTRNIIRYDNTFSVSQLPVLVNGRFYFAAESEANQPEEGNFMQVDTVIESVEVTVLESFPMQLRLTVTGYQPDGCDFPVQVVQERDENTVSVHIFRDVPADVMCPMMLVSYEDGIMMEGGFSSGTVTINVNDQTVTVDL